MTEHPLHPKLIDALSEYKTCPEAMRDAYDLGRDDQLKQVQKELKHFLEEFSCLGHSADAVLDLRAFVNNFQSIMRPQEDN
jgi:hypothetical protein